jgi:hypothetical protein
MREPIFAATATQTNGSSQPAQQGTSIYERVSESLDADLFIFSGGINRALTQFFIDEVDKAQGRENAVLIICSNGGDADAAYIIARILKSHYKKFILFVYGFCKSAGTLLALGADEIVMSDRGELGPLDVQVIKSDELLYRSSGLDIPQAIESLSQRAYDIFENHFLSLIFRGGGAITTKTAAEIATSLAVGLLAPITAQVDPLRVGETERAINIAQQYGERLSGDPKKVERLIKDYPSHSFVIDFTEASNLFGNVRRPNALEIELEAHIRSAESTSGRSCISRPNEKGMVGYINTGSGVQNEQPTEESTQSSEDGASTAVTAEEGTEQPAGAGQGTNAAAQAAASSPGTGGQG